ncbi:MAG: sugar transferase [Lachnospiraceae bacterium]|nr:sugar transferase [Lachnospiraceae bacterium]MDY5742516.1 sugar transferase [Lachnospiraceae bacterium]
MLRKWKDLPPEMQTEAVRPYYEILKRKSVSLQLKRLFDVVFGCLLLAVASPILLIISILIVTDSRGGVFYRQERVTSYNRVFRIFKFRTMVANADRIGSQVTVNHDSRITKVGHVLRKYRLDELPQLLNIIAGDMSFVGTRPESVYYVKAYTPQMYATLLLPAGVTSLASITYKDEAKLLEQADDVDEVYIKTILPAKMAYNLKSIRRFSLLSEFGVMIKTVFAVLH